MANENINIVLSTDNNYAQHATVAMISALCNTKQPELLRFFVIDDNIEKVSKAKMLASVEKLNGSLSFVKPNIEALTNVFVSGNLTRAAYLRLDIPNILPQEVKKAIYMDCDILVFDDLNELWKLDLHGKPVAAIEDFGILASYGKSAEKERNLNWHKEFSYFNSGVLVIDVQQWREQNYANKLIQLVQEKNFRHHDQDALNFLFMNNWCQVALRWNVVPPIFNMPMQVFLNKKMRTEALQALKNIAIIHYAGGYKPWEYLSNKGFNDRYYEYLAKSEYRDAIMPQPNLKKKGHSLRRQLWRLRWAEFVRKMFS